MEPDSLCPKCRKRPRRRSGEPCKVCHAANERARRALERERREASNYAPLKPGDFELPSRKAGVSRDGHDRNADREKKQEYSLRMGEFADMLRAGGSPAEQAQLGTYMARLAEEERRFGNRRIARSVSISAAHEALARRQFLTAAREHLVGKVSPSGYALRPVSKPTRRTVVLLLSDLHIGADLHSRDNPEPYGAVQESRRLGKLVYEAAEYKPQYREHSELLVCLNGDLIEGFLLHDMRDGAPLTEQKIAFLRYFRAAFGFWAKVYPRVRVVCQPGNHGRNKLRHPGRATSSKWDGVEWELYQCLQMLCSELRNVTWEIPFQAVSVVDLYGAKMLLTHGDTEVKVKHPDGGSAQNAAQMHKINSTRLYGHQFDVAAFGHFHTPRYQPKRPTKMVFNGALVPGNGYARSEGYNDEPCGQYLWEAVEGYPVGDMRFVEVGAAEDRDAKLNSVIEPFRFPLAA